MNWSSLGFVTLMFFFTLFLVAKHFNFDPDDESRSPPLSEQGARRSVMIIASLAMIAVAITM